MTQRQVDNIYDSAITFENIYKTWNTVRKTCKNRKAVYRFAVNKSTNIYNIYKTLKEKTYKPLPFRLFLIFEPKARLVMSQSVGDKIVNHFVANYYILPYLEQKLIDSNVATRKEKGSGYASILLEKYINQIRLKQKGKEIYCLKIDISKYFYRIDHAILMKKITKYIKDQDVLNLISIIVQETNQPYVNKLINIFNQKYKTEIPLYNENVGLSIGAMTSQFFAIYYLNDLDHLIKEELKCKHYIRYMDDFIILDTDKEKLKKIWKIIAKEIEKLNLKVNPKSNITRLSIGFSFLGYKYQITKQKLKITYRKKTIKKIKKRLQYLEKNDKMKFYRTYGSYYGYLKKVKKQERKFSMKTLEKYEYYKEKNPKHILFIKEGSFYKTFKEDAVIIWYLFGYKWNNNTISFGASPYSKVLNKLNSLGISYGVITDTETFITNDEEIYDLYRNLATINYKKFKKREELHNFLDRLINKNFDNYDLILKKFEELEGVKKYDEEVEK